MKNDLHDLIHLIVELDKEMLKTYEYMKKLKELMDRITKEVDDV